MSLLPSAYAQSPANAWFRFGAIAAFCIFIPLIVFFQWFQRENLGRTLSERPANIAEREDIVEPGVDKLTVQSKLFVKERHMVRTRGSGRVKAWSETIDADRVREIEKLAITRPERLRAAIVAGELQGAAAALARIDKLMQEAEKHGDLSRELVWVRSIYSEAKPGAPAVIPEEASASLVERHGWFGQLALTHGMSETDPRRLPIVSGFQTLGGSMMVVYGLIAISTLIGFPTGIVMLLKLFRSEADLRYTEPWAPVSVYFEMFCVFAALFFFLLVASVLVLGVTSAWAVVLTELLLWSMACTLLYPMMRGLTIRQMADDLGLTTGEGVIKEIGIGILGWLGAVPLAFVGGILGRIVEGMIAEPGKSDGFPIFEQPLGGSWVMVWIGAITAVVWAPLVEELLFRGALYAGLRSRLGWVWSVVISSVLFGLIHPYTPSGMISVAFGGVAFGLLREWRGTLIPCIVAHALHNATITTVTITVLSGLE